MKHDIDALVAALTGKPYEPQWKGPVEGWIINFLHAGKGNYWRVQSSMEVEDVMQEAYCCFLRIKRRYKVTNGAHFMALFKSSWIRYFDDLSSEDSKHRAVLVTDVVEHDDGTPTITVEPIGDLECDGYLATLIRQAPSEVLTVLNLMLRAPQEIVAEVLSSWNGRGDARAKAGDSRRVNELLGLPLDQDTLGAVRAYFAP
jgi:hypothetical protein